MWGNFGFVSGIALATPDSYQGIALAIPQVLPLVETGLAASLREIRRPFRGRTSNINFFRIPLLGATLVYTCQFGLCQLTLRGMGVDP
jgi:hypothetical protein